MTAQGVSDTTAFFLWCTLAGETISVHTHGRLLTLMCQLVWPELACWTSLISLSHDDLYNLGRLT